MDIGENFRRYRRRLCETVGLDWYSRPALDGLDVKLWKRMPIKGGFFIEAGANDGYSQSNTYYLERIHNWSGILVEPIPELFEKCVRERPRARVFNCALVPFNHPENSVEMVHCNLMSLVKGAMGDQRADEEHITRGAQVQPGVNVYSVSVPARTLTSILDECAPPRIDLLSLDVEGFEISVLQGLDFERHRPRHICLEVRQSEEVSAFLKPRGYSLLEVLSEGPSKKDMLFFDSASGERGG